jgi:outer membrane protein, multidrug efflux system
VNAGIPSARREPPLSPRQGVAAEENLIAANANIGVAKAAYFPQITLTGLLGFRASGVKSAFSFYASYA